MEKNFPYNFCEICDVSTMGTAFFGDHFLQEVVTKTF